MMFSSSTRLGRLTLFCQAGLQLHVNDGDKLVNIFSDPMYFWPVSGIKLVNVPGSCKSYHSAIVRGRYLSALYYRR
ncbi:hypothetical protein C8J23_10596 [Shewanella chilikensis]|uniref:Uncharacterized protein n=1 Tax=Shewanella chilikensis TaxID=558541 RepID=A0ABX5PR92_9GAMM|nr:hypothetical protein C8J23_10596 [Shewanella chilikensis]